MKSALEEMGPIDGREIHVAHAQTLRHVEKLLCMKGRPLHFDLGIVNMRSDLGGSGPVPLAFMLEEKRKTPVLIYSPLYTGERLQQLQGMVSGAFSGVFEQSEIPEAAELFLREPQKSKKFCALLKTMRYMGNEGKEAQKKIMELIGTMTLELKGLTDV